MLDVASGTGNAAIPAAQQGAHVTASDLTPELLQAGAQRAQADGLELDWVTADAEHLPFEDESFDIVMSSIGVMFAPRHQAAADELVRVCRPGGKIALLSWTPEGMLGALFRTMAPFAPPPPPGASPAPLWGSESPPARAVRATASSGARSSATCSRSPPSRSPRDYGEHFKAYYGPTIGVRANASKQGRADEFDAALDAFCDDWNLGGADQARFEKEFLVAVGTRA